MQMNIMDLETQQRAHVCGHGGSIAVRMCLQGCCDSTSFTLKTRDEPLATRAVLEAPCPEQRPIRDLGVHQRRNLQM